MDHVPICQVIVSCNMNQHNNTTYTNHVCNMAILGGLGDGSDSNLKQCKEYLVSYVFQELNDI